MPPKPPPVVKVPPLPRLLLRNLTATGLRPNYNY